MHDTKAKLIIKHGTHCMLCGKDVSLKIQWHHIRPRYDFKRHGETPDDTVDNGSLLCKECHKRIHHYDYEDESYQELTFKILQNKGE